MAARPQGPCSASSGRRQPCLPPGCSCPLAAHRQLGQQGEGGGSAPLLRSAPLRSALLRARLGSRDQLWGPRPGQDMELLGRVRGLEHLCCEGRLRDWGLFSLGKRRLRGDLPAAYQYLKGPTGELERGVLQGPVVTGQGAMAVN